MALTSYNTFASARLDRPDQSLRRIAIKQMSGQALNASEIDRLARRQGVEARYEQFGNPSFSGSSGGGSGMDSAYARAGAPFGIRSRLMSEGSTLGRLGAEYGDGNIGGVQQLARERLLRERELGNLAVDNARWNAARRQEDYDWAQELRERQRKNWEAADRRLADEESGHNAIMGVVRDEQQIDNTPSSLLAPEYRNGDGSPNRNAVLENRINEAAVAGDYGAFSALNRELLSRQGAARSAEADGRKAREGDLRLQKLEADLQKSRAPAELEFVNAPDGSLLYKYGNTIEKLGNSRKAAGGYDEYPSRTVVVRDAGGKIVEVIQPYIQTVGKDGVAERKPNPRYIDYMNAHGNLPPADGGNGTAGQPPKDAQTKRGDLMKKLGF